MAKRVDILLHSDYPPEACLAKLTEEMDIDERTIFSLSGYDGHGPVLGRISGNQFRLHKRRYWHNSFAPVLFGCVRADGRGTLIEAYWEMWPGVRFFMRIWIILAVVLGTPTFLIMFQDLIRHGFVNTPNWWIGLAVPPGLVFWGLLLPRLGAAMASHEKGYLVEFLKRTLVAATAAAGSFDGTWKSTFDRL